MRRRPTSGSKRAGLWWNILTVMLVPVSLTALTFLTIVSRSRIATNMPLDSKCPVFALTMTLAKTPSKSTCLRLSKLEPLRSGKVFSMMVCSFLERVPVEKKTRDTIVRISKSYKKVKVWPIYIFFFS